ncbi:MAG: alpha/beta hydrolase [Porticoccaceae bacterium]|nr:alpha/beta hydrolase [Porticoccaceae bacterium]
MTTFVVILSWPVMLFSQALASGPEESKGFCYVDGLAERLRCGYVSVAEDPGKPNGRKIDVHYVVIPAVKPIYENEALLAIAGGPGQSAIDNAALFNSTFSKVRETRDILLIDQRGTGRSNLLSCPEDTALSPLMVDERAFNVLAETKKCLDALNADVAMYNSTIALNDFEAVRQALGYKKLHLYGISYGSRMAQLYMRHYGDSLATVTLDGVVPMQIPVIAVGLSVDRALAGLLKDCAEDVGCADKFPNLTVTLDSINSQLENQPIVVNTFHPVTGDPTEFFLTRDKLLSILRLSMYSTTTRSLLPLAIHHASLGNYQALLGLYSLMMEGIDLAAGMHNSVVCAEDIQRVNSTLLGEISASYMADTLYQALIKACSVWPSHATNPEFSNPISSAVPTLLLSGELDPATPPDWGTMAMKKMTNAVHFIAPYATHGVASQSCGNELIAQLIDTANIQTLNNDCLDEDQSTGFYLNGSSAQMLPNNLLKEGSL